MSAYEWVEDGATAAEDFTAYDGNVVLVNGQGLFYISLEDHGQDQRLSMVVKSKEIMRMAHWIIKEFS